MTLGLLRILEISAGETGEKGSIILDGINIEDVGLHCMNWIHYSLQI
jgi:hypothetical protein